MMRNNQNICKELRRKMEICISSFGCNLFILKFILLKRFHNFLMTFATCFWHHKIYENGTAHGNSRKQIHADMKTKRFD